MSGSILNDTKKILGIDADYDAFDLDIMTHINSALSTLNQIGVGPLNGFMIDDADAQWVDFMGPDPRISSAKTYVYLSVRLLFDPPATSYVLSAWQQQIQELAWRLEVARIPVVPAAPINPDIVLIDGGDAA